MRRRVLESVASRNRAVVERRRELKADYPFWGYRHCWAHLRYVDKLDVNRKRVYRLLKEHNPLAIRTKHEVTRVSTRPKPGPNRPKQWSGIDRTRVMTESGWVYLVLVLDWYTKQIDEYNESYWHSALTYRTPHQGEETYNLTTRTLLQNAR